MRFKSNLGLIGLAIATILTISTQNSCTEEMLQELEKQQQEQQPQSGDSIVTPPAKDSVYTIASYLEADTTLFTDFTKILKRSAMWDSLSSTDNSYTCFALTNEAVHMCLMDLMRGASIEDKLLYSSVETLPDSICTVIAKRHLVRDIIRLDTLQDGDGDFRRNNLLGEPLGRYAVVSEYIQSEGNQYTRLRRYEIGYSKVIIVDMPVSNGILQCIDQPFPDLSYEPDSEFIPGLLRVNNDRVPDYLKATIFFDALRATRLSDTLEQYLDWEYFVDYDKTMECFLMAGRPSYSYHSQYEQFNTVFPDQRLFKYTLFTVTDSILSNVYGINSLEDLERYARRMYPEGTDYENNSPQSSLYKLMSYHILPEWMPYNSINTHQPEILNNRTMKNEMDVEDFFETMQPHAIMRISTPLDLSVERPGTYINRKGTVSAGNLSSRGIRIWLPEENPQANYYALNGGFYYVDRLLVFDNETQNALTTRIRVMASTLSPDFINSGARGRMVEGSYRDINPNCVTYQFLPGFCKNFKCNNDTPFIVVPRSKDYGCLYGDELLLLGYDITFRLPPVPVSASYEIRLWNYAIDFRDQHPTVQFYLGQSESDLTECGEPIDLSLKGTDPSIGYISDQEIREQNRGASEETIQALIQENDDLMRSNGYMKSPDIYQNINNINLRDEPQGYRVIVYRGYMQAGQDYYLRMKTTNTDAFFYFNFIELVPKDIYQGDEPEDRH